VTRRLHTHTPRHRLRSPDGLRRCHPPCLPIGGTAAANGSGLAPASRSLRIGTPPGHLRADALRWWCSRLRRSPGRSGPSRPSGRGRLRCPRPLRLEGPTLHAGRYASCGYGCIEGSGLCGGRSAKPRGAAPELAAHYARGGRATSHNGVRYAFVHPARTRGSHVALSGAPPRWNRNVLFPWRCSWRVRAWSVMRAPPQNAPRPLAGENPTPVFPSGRASSFRCPCRRRPGHPQLQARPFTPFPDSRHESCGANFRAGPYAPRRIRRANGVGTPDCLRVASGRGFAAFI
jgi:hypothetical protein